MKIVVLSLSFLPNVGGLENIMAGLAIEWSKGHDVKVYTKTKIDNTESSVSYQIIRKFNLFTLFTAVKHADVFIEANISLKTCLVGLINIKKWHVIHHTYYGGYQTSFLDEFKRKLKIILTLFSKNISCSHFVSSYILGKSVVIPNFYNDEIFKLYSLERNKKSLVFLGRLVTEKGVDFLLYALGILKNRGQKYQLSIIGEGPEELNLREIVRNLDLDNLVSFKGTLRGDELSMELNCHDVMVIPSRCKEAFGIVALEGLACGCKIVCPDEGGLKESAGQSSFLYRYNDLASLTVSIELAFAHFSNVDNFFIINDHLNQHIQSKIANKYLDYINCSLGG